MKKAFLWLFALILIVTAAACQAPNPADSVPSETEQTSAQAQDSEIIQLTVKEQEIEGDAESLTLMMTNTTENEYTYGAMVTIETEKNGAWEELKPDKDIFWDAVGYILKSGQATEQTVWLNNSYGTLAAGNYRFVKTFISEDGTNLTAYGPFTVKERI